MILLVQACAHVSPSAGARKLEEPSPILVVTWLISTTAVAQHSISRSGKKELKEVLQIMVATFALGREDIAVSLQLNARNVGPKASTCHLTLYRQLRQPLRDAGKNA